MRSFSPAWVLIAAVCGAAYGASGYNPESLRGLVVLSGSLALFVVVAVVLMPILVRVNDGRWDRRKVRTGAAQLVAGGAVLAALMLVEAGVCRLAADATGGWQGGWSEATVGAALGVAVALSVRFAVAVLRLFERLGLGAPDAPLVPTSVIGSEAARFDRRGIRPFVHISELCIRVSVPRPRARDDKKS
jgi:hypothetical protein